MPAAAIGRESRLPAAVGALTGKGYSASHLRQPAGAPSPGTTGNREAASKCSVRGPSLLPLEEEVMGPGWGANDQLRECRTSQGPRH